MFTKTFLNFLKAENYQNFMLINKMCLKIFYDHSVAVYYARKCTNYYSFTPIIIMNPLSDFRKK